MAICGQLKISRPESPNAFRALSVSGGDSGRLLKFPDHTQAARPDRRQIPFQQRANQRPSSFTEIVPVPSGRAVSWVAVSSRPARC